MINYLSDLLAKIKPHQEVILAEDVYGKIKEQEDNMVVGRFADEIQNDIGDWLIEIYTQYSMQITNTRFAHEDIHRYSRKRSYL